MPQAAPLLYGADGRTLDPFPAPGRVEDETDDEPEDYGDAPKNTLYQELPVYGVPPPDRTWVIESILQSLEVGQFHDAAWLWDAMKRDARIRSVMRTRVQGLLGSGVECSALMDSQASLHGNSKSARAQLVAEELVHTWPRMHDQATLARAIDYALGLGVCVLEKRYVSGARWDYRLKLWHPQFLTYHWDTRRYHLTTQNKGQIPLPRPEEISSQWIVLCPYGYDYAYLEGLVRALAAPWLGRNWDQSDWGRYNEIHGRAIRLAYVPENAKDAHKKAFFSQVARLNAEAAIRLPVDKDGKGYDLKLLEAVARTYETFEKKLAWADRTIAILALGQATSTDGSSGLGSDANPGDSVRLDVKKGDNSWLSQALYDQGIREWVAFNWGDPDLAPIPPADDKRSGYYQVEPAADSAKRATELRDFARGFAGLSGKTKAIDERQLLDSFGLPLVTEAEQKKREDEAAANAKEITGIGPEQKPGVPAEKEQTAGEQLGADLAYLKREAMASTDAAALRRRLGALYSRMNPALLDRLAAIAWAQRTQGE